MQSLLKYSAIYYSCKQEEIGNYGTFHVHRDMIYCDYDSLATGI
jgi:hypothetical protein